MKRTQIQLPDKLYERLKMLAEHEETFLAAILRRGAEYILSLHPEATEANTEWHFARDAAQKLQAELELVLILKGGLFESVRSAKKYCRVYDPNVGRIFKAVDFIEANAHRRLTVEEVARECAYSPDHFSRLFKHTLGIPPSCYIQRTKCEMAKTMLFSGLSCSQIADELAFVSTSHLSRVFRRKMPWLLISGCDTWKKSSIHAQPSRIRALS